MLNLFKRERDIIKVMYLAGSAEALFRNRLESGEVVSRSYLQKLGKLLSSYAKKDALFPEKFYHAIEKRINPDGEDREIAGRRELQEAIAGNGGHYKTRRTWTPDSRSDHALDAGERISSPYRAPNLESLMSQLMNVKSEVGGRSTRSKLRRSRRTH